MRARSRRFSSAGLTGVLVLVVGLGSYRCTNGDLNKPSRPTGSTNNGDSTGTANSGTKVDTTGMTPAEQEKMGSSNSTTTDTTPLPKPNAPTATPSTTPETKPTTGWKGIAGVEDLSTVKMSSGCGKQPAGDLAADKFILRKIDVPAVPLRGDGVREFYLKLPAAYNSAKPYRVVFVAPGCGGTGSNPPFSFTASAAGEGGVIQVGLQREENTSQNGPCFDDKRTDSIEYMYFEKTLDYVKSNLCADEHRIFVTGHSSGSWLTNQLGCVYGSKLIRAVGPASGGLATADIAGAGAVPPCKDLPTPGIWVHNEGDMDNKIIGSQRAIERALVANRCTNTSFTGPRVPWQAPGSGTSCEKFSTCPAEFPIVFCHPAGGAHPPPVFATAAIWQFFQGF